MQFSKWHALGNSYLVVERDEARPIDDRRVRRLCDGETGIGSDGLIEVVRHEGPVAEIVIWNPDGSTAEMSGNGIRIAARWLAAISEADEIEIRTAGRSVQVRMLGDRDARAELGDVAVGEPEVIDANGPVELTTASLGNPHAVIRLDSASRDDLVRLGPLVETHPRFPERTNVQLVRVDGGNDLTVLVWERGAGETSASGSSAVAAAAVAVSRGWCRSPITVHLPGGDLVVELDQARATLVGPAERICTGTTEL